MTDEEYQILRWHLAAAQIADHKAMGKRHRVCSEPVDDAEGLDFARRADARLWLASKRRNLVRLVELAAERGWHFETWALAEALWAYFTDNGNYDDAERCYRLAAAAAEAAGDDIARIRMLLLLGQTLTDARSFEDAAETLETARSVAQDRIDDPDPEIADQMFILLGTGLEFTGRLLQKCEQLAEALVWFERALDNALEQDRRAEHGNPRVVALQHWFLAQCHRELANTVEATDHFAEAGRGLRAADDPRTGIMVRIDTALFALEHDEPKAARNVEQALELAAQEEELVVPAADGWLRFAESGTKVERGARLERALALYKSVRHPGADEARKLLGEL